MDSKLLIHFKVPGKPQSLKNSKRVGKGNIYSSDKYQDWARLAFREIMGAKKNTLPVEGEVHLKMLVYLRNRKSEPDLSNSYQGIEDLLQAAGVIKNDKQINSHDGSRKIYGSKSDFIDVSVFLMPKY